MSDFKKIWTERRLFKAEAFRSLRGSSIKVYFDFRLKLQWKPVKPSKPAQRGKEWVPTNNGELIYTYGEAKKNGFNPPRFRDALDELVEKGFIDITHSGGGIEGDCSKYAVSERWRKYGKEDFEELIRPKDLRKGRGFARMHDEKKKSKELKAKKSTNVVKLRRRKETQPISSTLRRRRREVQNQI